MFYLTHINYTLLLIKKINVLLECIKLLSVHIILMYLAVCSIKEYPSDSDIVLFFIIITAMFALLLQEVYLLLN